ncbi:MAG: T9SS type A sorting domain-containing protein [Lentimicrobiaceae bacterium]|jgi:YD repeat-containing protein
MIKHLLLSACLLLISLSQLLAQQYTYVYDAAGNRTKVTLLKSSQVDPANIESKEAVVVTDEGREFKLYPNPTKGLVTIECPGLTEDSKVTCTIHDASGRFISNAVYTGQQTIKCDLSNVPNGLYILQIKLPDTQHVLKVLKE